ncbi:hypothetical protein FHX82_000767 [Amycolatopsis bartoniae]|nr:hypothetical protein [Amycolatopsis bartoniae]
MDLAGLEVDRVLLKAEDLAAAPATPRGQVDDRSVPLRQRLVERVHLFRLGDVVAGVRNLGQADAHAWRGSDPLVDHGRVEHRHEDAVVDGCERARGEVLSTVLDPSPDVGVPHLRERQTSHDRRDVVPDDPLSPLGRAVPVELRLAPLLGVPTTRALWPSCSAPEPWSCCPHMR